jgi:hypothetical protein
LGGQHHSGAQKDGILKYDKGKPCAIYDPDQGDYVAFDSAGWSEEADQELGPLPEGYQPWKALLMSPKKAEVLEKHFQQMKSMDSEGAALGMEYLKASKTIGERLVSDGVAARPEDVNGVLTNGFYHLYGPINDYTG